MTGLIRIEAVAQLLSHVQPELAQAQMIEAPTR